MELSERYLLDPHVTLDISDDAFKQMQNESNLSPLLINTEAHRKFKLVHRFPTMTYSELICIMPQIFHPVL